jgi:hypothetical protein
MVQNSAKIERFELKKSFKLYGQILSRVFTKVGLNFVHFAWLKVREMNPRVNYTLENPIFLYQPIKTEVISNEILKLV